MSVPDSQIPYSRADGKVQKRVGDYHKLSRRFDFDMLRAEPSADEQVPMKRAANVFWFGDLNFRLSQVDAVEILRAQLHDRLFRQGLDFEKLLRYDELNHEKGKGAGPLDPRPPSLQVRSSTASARV